MNNHDPLDWRSQVFVAALFGAIGLVVLAVFVLVAEPAERRPHPPFNPNYSEQPLVQRLARHEFEHRLEEIAAAGAREGERSVGRLSGSPGFYRTESLIREAFERAGLEVHTQELTLAVPVTKECEVLGADGQPLPDVRLYPFEPAGLLPAAVPPEGLRATLVPAEGTALKYLAGHDPEHSIVLTYLDSAAEWMNLASLGVKAVIVREDDLARAMRNPDQAGQWVSLTVGFDTAYPRFLAHGPLEKYAGQEITIRCRVVWESRPVRNLVGVLRGRGSPSEALVLASYYDSNSVVPELAPGAEQSIPLAVMLAYADALAPYRGQLQRDVIFVATAGHAQSMAGVSRLLEARETFTKGRPDYRSLEDRRQDEREKLAYTQKALAWLDTIEREPAAAYDRLRDRWMQEDPGFRRWFHEAFQTVAGEISLESQDRALEARLRYLRAGSPVYVEGFDPLRATDDQRKAPENSHPLLRDYLEARRLSERSGSLMSLSLWELADRPEFSEWHYVDRARSYLQTLDGYHQQQIKELGDTLALQKLLAGYQQTLTINLELYSGGANGLKDLALLVGIANVGPAVEPTITELANALRENVPATNQTPDFQVIQWGLRDATGSAESPNRHTRMESEVWFRCGFLAFTAVNYAYFPTKICTPEDTLEGLPRDVLRRQVPALGRTVLMMANGRVPFKTILSDRARTIFHFHGTVYGSAGVATMIPRHPMAAHTFVEPYMPAWLPYSGDLRVYAAIYTRGIRTCPVLPVNPYGAYSMRIHLGFSMWYPVAVNAARFDDDGRVQYYNDSSPASQSVFNNDQYSPLDVLATGEKPPKPINLALFRCSTTALYNQINPKTMKNFQRVDYLSQLGLSAPPHYHLDRFTAFLEPDLKFYVGLLDGAPDNEEIQVYRAFLLNARRGDPLSPGEPDLFGRGYLAADHPNLIRPQFDAAASMLRTAEKRLHLQQRYSMADDLMLTFQRRAAEWLSSAETALARNQPLEAANAAGASLAYAINNHPVIRGRISQAVIGILWYLGLLVPFVFFAEKLLFGFADIRKQLLADGVIFLVVFGLLRVFHPAFPMVRSSLMILLGFVTLLLTVLVTLMVGGRFQQSIRELRSKEGRVEGADVSRGGVIGTAFLLGLNNMRRRPVRTGLTCGTLVLITFVMICFTSVSSDLVDTEYPTGRSPWNGIMLRDSNFRTLDPAEVYNLRQIYGDRFPVSAHRWLVPLLGRGTPVRNPDLVIERAYRAGATAISRRATVNSAIEMEAAEPMFSGLDRSVSPGRKWFPNPPLTRSDRLAARQEGYLAQNWVILPDTVARDLGVTIQNLKLTNVTVNIRGEVYQVLGIIDTVALGKSMGLDGQPLLPYDLNSVQGLGTTATGQQYLVPEDVGRMKPSQVILVNKMPLINGAEQNIIASCAVLFPQRPYRMSRNDPLRPAVDYRDQRRLLMDFLERTGEPAYYAIDGVSYYGMRRRVKTMAGLLELLVPVLIAAFTVFNTMRGSVYERKDEIYVYNAVGIAPNHVFFMFMAEALVYAVVGAMLGYLLSQAVGRTLTALHWTGGLNMDYSSIETVYASLTLMGAVLLSTLLPARDAARMASPSEIVSWRIPETVGDAMEFNLPFTFTAHDRVAVISYFHRWLDANGVGSSGPFFCSPPQPQLTRTEKGPKPELVPGILSTVWLKPYDLGVSQRLEISLPTDPETGEFVARIRLVRLSGHAASWNRSIKPFLGSLRKQFLNWRATTTADRQEMFAEAKQMLVKVDAEGSSLQTTATIAD